MPTTTRGYPYPSAGDPTNVPGDLQALAAAMDADVGGNTARRVVAFNVQTGTAYTIALADAADTIVRLSNAAAITLTVPTNASVAFPVGSVVNLLQYGAGQVTIAAAGGVTLRSYQGALKLAGQYAQAVLVKLAADEWAVAGAVTT